MAKEKVCNDINVESVTDYFNQRENPNDRTKNSGRTMFGASKISNN